MVPARADSLCRNVKNYRRRGQGSSDILALGTIFSLQLRHRNRLVLADRFALKLFLSFRTVRCLCALKQKFAFAGVAREAGGSLELLTSLVETVEFHKKVSAHAWQQMIILEGWLIGQRIDDLKTGGRAK